MLLDGEQGRAFRNARERLEAGRDMPGEVALAWTAPASRAMPDVPPSFTRQQIAGMSAAEFLANEKAINEAKNILGTDYSVDIVLHWGAGAYIVGEETALIESLEGNRGMPRLKPPYFPAAKGLYMQPTVVNNVETLANLPWIALHGGQAFADLGAENSRGTRLFAVSGHVENPGVFEVEFGTTTFRDLLYGDEFSRGIRDGNDLKAFVPGGGSAPWFLPDQLDIPFEGPQAGAAGSMLGSGAVMVMDETVDVVRSSKNLSEFYKHESCGWCTPCREGTDWIVKIFDRIDAGGGRPEDAQLLLDICDNIEGKSFCPLGDAAAWPVQSAIKQFPDDFRRWLVDKTGIDLEPATR